jgi:hypothetical protein
MKSSSKKVTRDLNMIKNTNMPQDMSLRKELAAVNTWKTESRSHSIIILSMGGEFWLSVM